ncbi:MAG: hypothetical protein HOY79_50060 [Streptomyces sp.]|nr:hypothetical protein [Streptomyces sp.]
MSSTSAADELRQAAARLRGLVEDLGDCRGPWYVVNREKRPYPQRIDNIGVPYVVAGTATDPSHPPTTADYITAMHPGVGKALAAWLEAEGKQEAYTLAEFGHRSASPHALSIARQINGGAT